MVTAIIIKGPELHPPGDDDETNFILFRTVRNHGVAERKTVSIGSRSKKISNLHGRAIEKLRSVCALTPKMHGID